MIKGRILSITQTERGVEVCIIMDYPSIPYSPAEYDFVEKQDFEKAVQKYEVKKLAYQKEKQEIDLLHLGLVNLFQDDDHK